MFDPSDFLTIARELSDSARKRGRGPAALRTAFGRVYYALYLLVREELATRYRIHHRHLPHGAVFTHLQSPRAGRHVRELGRDLQRMYRLRQAADYELAPNPVAQGQLADAGLAGSLIEIAERRAKALPRLDFAPVVPLLDPGGGHLHT